MQAIRDLLDHPVLARPFSFRIGNSLISQNQYNELVNQEPHRDPSSVEYLIGLEL